MFRRYACAGLSVNVCGGQRTSSVFLICSPLYNFETVTLTKPELNNFG